MKRKTDNEHPAAGEARSRRERLRRLAAAMAESVWRHKYFWTILVFVVHVGFVDSNSFWDRRRLAAENAATQARIDQYEAMYRQCDERLRHLRTSPEALVRVAREDHRMKASGEDVYYITEPSDSLH